MSHIFLHIPKSAGNTFLDFLLPNFEPQNRFDVNEGLVYTKRLDELQRLPDASKQRINLVYGHLPFGVHQWLSGPWRYFTIFRDPIDRVVSHYYYVREQPTHPLYEPVTSQDLTLKEYAESGLSAEISNGMTRLICGDPEIDSIRGHAQCDESHLKAAVDHLQSHFSVFGLVEQFDLSLKLMSLEFGWPLIPMRPKNVTRARKSVAELDAQTVQAIADNNRLDIELYDLAKREFQGRIDARRSELAALQIPPAPSQDTSNPRLLQRIKAGIRRRLFA